MTQRLRFFTVRFGVMVILVLAACGPAAPATEAPVATEAPATAAPTETPILPCTEIPSTAPLARIDCITHTPASAYPIIGELVVFTIQYKIASSDENLTDITLEVYYSESLMYCESGSTSKSGESCRSEPAPAEVQAGFLTYKFEELPSETEKTGTVEVSFDLNIEEGSPAVPLQFSAQIRGGISQGTLNDSRSVEISEGGVAETYPEGALVWLPWQASGKGIHSERREFSFDPAAILVAGAEYVSKQTIIYLEVFEESNERITSFDPAITMEAAIPEDLKGQADLVILLYDGKAEQWIPCDGNNYDVTTQCTGTIVNTETGRASIDITVWTSGAAWGCRGCAQ